MAAKDILRAPNTLSFIEAFFLLAGWESLQQLSFILSITDQSGLPTWKGSWLQRRRDRVGDLCVFMMGNSLTVSKLNVSCHRPFMLCLIH
jgi:hypothetical protein